MRSVLVVGAGFAGLGAAYAAATAGARVSLVLGRAGASELGSGALDELPWSELGRALELGGAPLTGADLDDPSHEVMDRLGLFACARGGAPLPVLATTAGVLRLARGHDAALLDLAAHPGKTVCLPRVARPGWDADALARTLGASPRAKALGLRFVAFDAKVLRYTAERSLPDADLARRHDDPARLEWLAARLREGLERVEGERVVLLGPWLGLAEPRAAALRAAIELPVGEALVGVGSPAGMRFVAARDRLLEQASIARIEGVVERVDPSGQGYLTALRGEPEPIYADAVVLAIGGVVGGGLRYEPADYAAGPEGAERPKRPFRLSLAVEAELALGGAPLGVTSSLQGPDLSSPWPRGARAGDLEAVGVRCEADGAVASARAGLYVAGDAIADRPRTAIAALRSGLVAGAAAATPGR